VSSLRAYDLRLVTESAAKAAHDGILTGDLMVADKSAISAMHGALKDLGLDARVLIGKGPRNETSVLYHGERLGVADGKPQWDLVLDPMEGTSFLATGMTNAMACLAIAPPGTVFDPGPAFFMEKLVVPPAAQGKVDPNSPIKSRLKDLGLALKKPIDQLVIFVLEKPRHRDLVEQIKAAGAQVSQFPAGDVAGSLMAAIPNSGIDCMMGIGGSPEGILSAIAIKMMGGDFFCRLAPLLTMERKAVADAGLDTDTWIELNQLVCTDKAVFCATGISSGLLLNGIESDGTLFKVQSLLIDGKASPRQILTSWLSES
jgi:fructose-1,6-bisphosphatase II